MSEHLTVTVYDKAFVKRGWIGDPVAVTATVRHNAVGTAAVTVTSDHHRLPVLTANGARVVIDYDGQQLLSGPVRALDGAGPGFAGTVTAHVESDWRLLHRVLGWPVPTAALTAQTSAYDTRTGAAETVLKGFVQANAVTRLGLPVTVALDQARGTSITAALRFHPLADRLFPLVEQAGLGVSVTQQGTGLVLDVYVPATHPRTLSEQSGVVTDWGWSSAGPTMTRGVGGGQGEGTARTFVGSTDAARETAWGDVVETFVDARDADTTAKVDARLAEHMAEGGPRSGLKVTLSETGTFRYGRAVKVGDRVRLEVGPGVVVEDVLREAVLSYTRDDGLTVTPVVGERTDDPDRALARAIARVARGVRNLQRR